ncbi:MAG: type I methionyl aminopeptidase [Bacteroidota bacterium]
MIYYKTDEEVELVRESSLLVSKTLAKLAGMIRPGVTTLELDQVAEAYIRDHQGVPGFKDYNGFPNTLCVSRNAEVVHGIPSDQPLVDGDVVSIDCGVLKNGFYGDSAYTFEVGEVKEEVRELLRVTKECLYRGIDAAVAGNRIGDIGFAVQQHAEAHGFGVVRELVGHGLGKNLHESPEVPNYGKRGRGQKLQEGLVIAIEPMINLGGRAVRQAKDGWTILTRDGLPSAHFEHDIVVRKGKAEVLSTFEFIEEQLAVN